MNERIKELAEQAGVIFVPASIDYFGERHPSDILTKTMDVEKFAELIVRVCANICDSDDDTARILDAFGVE